jgi:NAD binding domain of 6-phosphogluconate dehydrogenase
MVCTTMCAAYAQSVRTSAQVRNLVNAGYPVTVWNRNPARCDPLVEAGAKVRCCKSSNVFVKGVIQNAFTVHAHTPSSWLPMDRT